MVSLKSSSILAAVVIKTFIVLSILEHVSSETEVQRCIKYVTNLYDDERPYEKFKKGFFELCKSNIRDFNEGRLPEGSEERLQRIGKPLDDEVYSKGKEISVSSSGAENSDDSSDEEETEKPKMIAFPGGKYDLIPLTLQSMNKYTLGYHKAVFHGVDIQAKYDLPTPKEFCEHTFPNKAEICANIMYKKLHIKPKWDGSKIFYFFYRIWTREYMVFKYWFEGDIQKEVDKTLKGEDRKAKSERIKNKTKFFHDLYAIILLYHTQFENLAKNPSLMDFEKVPTPEKYCVGMVGDSSNLNVYEDDS